MPPDATTPGLNQGQAAEVRVAQAWFWDGYYVRSGIDLQHRFGDEVSTVTDLDILGYSFDSSLVSHKRIGEVKTGTTKNTPRPLDRALWMRGLLALSAAEGGEVTTAFKPSGNVRDICRKLGVTVQTFDDLDARENRLHIKQVEDMGSHGPTIALLRREVQRFVKSDPVLERGYWFLISEVWFLEPFDALKRTLGLVGGLSTRWPAENHHDALKAARWFFAEAVSIATLNLAVIAGEANTMDSNTFRQTAAARLASGDIPFHALRALSEHVDTYLGKILAQVDAPNDLRMSAIGGLMPLPPDYTQPLLELISRLAAEAHVTAQLPRQMDAIVFERLARRRELTPAIRARLQLSDASERLIRLIAAFFRGQFGVPAVVDRVLVAPLSADTAASRQSGQPALFDAPQPPQQQ